MIRAIVISVILAAGGLASAGTSALKVHLPRTVVVEGDTLNLGQIAVVICDDADMASKACAVAMGRTPMLKEQLTIDRQTILSRLAASGLKENIQLSGAQGVVISRNEKMVSTQELLKAAAEFLEKTRPGPANCVWNIAKPPAELAVAKADDVQLKPRLGKDSPPDHIKVEIVVVSGEKELAVAQALFKLAYPARQAVAIADIPAGAVLTAENVRIETVALDRKPTEEFVSPVGQAAGAAIRAGTVIKPPVLRQAKREVIVARNQTVTMRIEGLGFVVSAVGQAMEDGRAGDLIKVRNVDTKRVILGKVAFDGTIEPLMDEVRK